MGPTIPCTKHCKHGVVITSAIALDCVDTLQSITVLHDAGAAYDTKMTIIEQVFQGVSMSVFIEIVGVFVVSIHDEVVDVVYLADVDDLTASVV